MLVKRGRQAPEARALLEASATPFRVEEVGAHCGGGMPKRRFKSGALGARLVVRVVALLGWGRNWQDLVDSASQLSMRDEIEIVVAHAVGAIRGKLWEKKPY
jgi:hypothetical protein